MYFLISISWGDASLSCKNNCYIFWSKNLINLRNTVCKYIPHHVFFCLCYWYFSTEIDIQSPFFNILVLLLTRPNADTTKLNCKVTVHENMLNIFQGFLWWWYQVQNDQNLCFVCPIISVLDVLCFFALIKIKSELK